VSHQKTQHQPTSQPANQPTNQNQEIQVYVQKKRRGITRVSQRQTKPIEPTQIQKGERRRSERRSHGSRTQDQAKSQSQSPSPDTDPEPQTADPRFRETLVERRAEENTRCGNASRTRHCPPGRFPMDVQSSPLARLHHSRWSRRGRNRAGGMATALVALHVAAHAKGLPAAGVGAAEGLLAGVRVRVDAQAGRAREGLVAGAADVAVVVLLVGRRGAGRREVVVMLPGGSERRDHLRRGNACGALRWLERRRSALVVHGRRGGELDRRGV
jgi:hypothetical protein